MSTVLAFGLFLQVVALLIVFKRVGKRWFSYTGVLFISMAFIMHGLTEIVQLIFPGRNWFRLLVSDRDLDSWVLIVSGAILLFAVVYSLTLRKRHPEQLTNVFNSQLVGNTLPAWWPLLVIVVVPGYILSVSASATEYGYWISGFLEQFLLIGMVLVFFGLLVRYRRALLTIILVQSILITLIGSRLSIVAAVVILISTAIRYRIQVVRSRQIAIIFLVAAIAMVAISGTRATVEREVFGETAMDRVSALFSGTQSLISKETTNQVLDDFVYRFDGNSFPAMLHSRLELGIAPAGFQPLWNNVLLSVPRFIYSRKLSRDLSQREEEVYMIAHYNLPMIDYIPTTFGIVFGYYGVWFFLIAVTISGWFFAQVDIWLQKSDGLLPLLVGVGLTYCIVFMEQGLRVYFLTFRGVLALYMSLWLLQAGSKFVPTLHRSPRLARRNASIRGASTKL